MPLNTINVAKPNILVVLNDSLASFQNGVDTIVAGCTTYGCTPTASTPTAIVEAIKTIATNGKVNGFTRLCAYNATSATATNAMVNYTITNSYNLVLIVTQSASCTIAGTGTLTPICNYSNDYFYALFNPTNGTVIKPSRTSSWAGYSAYAAY